MSNSGKSRYRYIDNLNNEIITADKTNEELHHRIKQLEREISGFKLDNKSESLSNLIAKAKILNGIKIVSDKVEVESLDELRNLADNLRNLLASKGIGLLASEIDGKAQIVCVVTDDLKDSYPAGK